MLLGNPGTAKSAFQYYYLLRMVNPCFMNQLPPNKRGLTEIPDLVVRQVGNGVELYDVKNLKGYMMKEMDVGLLQALDPDRALYFYEPLQSLKEPELNHFISTFATMSPNPVRYHEFRKKNPCRLYYPLRTLKELKAIYNHMITTSGVLDPPTDINYPEIELRFKEFGGVIRHVICSRKALADARQDKLRRIQELDFKVLLKDPNIERQEVSHYIMCYKVKTTGIDAYEVFDYDFVNNDVFEAVRTQAFAVDIRDMISTLIRYEETGAKYAAHLAPYYFEMFLADGLLRGKKWIRFFGGDLQKIENEKSFVVCKGALGSDLDAVVKRIIEGLPPRFDDMKEGMLYRSANPNFKAFDMLCKTKSNELLCIQVKPGRSNYFKIAEEMVIRKLKELGVLGDIKVRFAVVVLRTRAKKAKFNVNFPDEYRIETEVWGVRFL
jgi:hypothetical protein